MKVVFLLEEPSMAEFLQGFISRHWADLDFQCVPHDGKRDLLRSIPRKLRAWTEPGVRFVVLIDNDSGDCLALKRQLIDLCHQAGRPDTLVRIVCQELEAWFLGHPRELGDAFGDARLEVIGRRSKFKQPDEIARPSAELKALLPSFQKVSGARAMGRVLGRDGNASGSFNTFVGGIDRIVV